MLGTVIRIDGKYESWYLAVQQLDTPLVDASQRALNTIKDRYQSAPSRDQQSSFLDDQVIKQYIDFDGGAGPSTTGETPSPAKSVKSEHGTIVENQNSPGNKSPVPPSDYSEGLVEVPHKLEIIFHTPRKVLVNDELVKALTTQKDSEIGEISIEFSTLWAKMTFSSVCKALKDEALNRFRETGGINPTIMWFRNALNRLAQGWHLCNKNGAVVCLEGELCSNCQRRLDGGEDFCIGCIGPFGGVCGECSAKGAPKCLVKTNNPESKLSRGAA
ncbi:hypothetical protein TREMEDRAFT_64917 [Tremella mesenterica DSM 1558]|uniref:uncharacterized protein n=1 Tax=Tremella mesenterica (strain ATCC 24925 / CBS 8224 / DSM 1558 / NBRC 9311 / NRRL Y-6157 / RJB 2259-6 / UBC 559-6) TaxID=578456 RepID=UPI0003F49E84|nr:uncharacterized protein TREMEDRAFT_64917 [Tremella mesenterica DSM 1558]EIW67049.1 hypothetical protein TREMEDRAFT_64917 [Tremella mesenterica DSM 1558]